MKKILILILTCLSILTGCSKNKEYKVNDVVEHLEKLNSYSLTSTMTIHKDDKTLSMDIAVDYLSPTYYKVVFGKNNEQIILKNDKGVFVLTPDLNKEFKFDGSWPNNSSHAYLIELPILIKSSLLFFAYLTIELIKAYIVSTSSPVTEEIIPDTVFCISHLFLARLIIPNINIINNIIKIINHTFLFFLFIFFIFLLHSSVKRFAIFSPILQ